MIKVGIVINFLKLSPKTQPVLYISIKTNLSSEAAAIVRNVITCPDKDDPYKQLKVELVKRCGESKSQIRCLLAGEQLGDRKPTDLLRVTQRPVENHQISDTLLLELFLQQLPQTVQSILLAISPLNATKAAEIENRIMEATPPEVSNISNSNSCANVNNTSQSEFLEEIKALREKVASLRRSRSASRGPRNNSRKRLSLSRMVFVGIIGSTTPKRINAFRLAIISQTTTTARSSSDIRLAQ
ncbi:uncharacterized protein LOC129958457 [Argiope bruennichi]|uniref:uncharacterized protein LOC129958457 n=1 Tax=Argiope bruennichi TaxID=94029 RepID=UPI00249423A8|nr:uncharacterized protein LOC129958457 [Argiope bruennichi]